MDHLKGGKKFFALCAPFVGMLWIDAREDENKTENLCGKIFTVESDFSHMPSCMFVFRFHADRKAGMASETSNKNKGFQRI